MFPPTSNCPIIMEPNDTYHRLGFPEADAETKFRVRGLYRYPHL